MTLNGNNDEVYGYNSVIKNGQPADTDLLKAVIPPIGSILAWVKTFGSADSGTTTSTTANKLVEIGQDFLTTVLIGMIIHNTTNDTFANVTAIDSDTILSIDNDIMTSGDTYIIYKTPQLPDGWAECDGSVLSDANSPYDGETIPNLNGTTDSDSLFLRGSNTSGGVGGSESHNHGTAVATTGGLSVAAATTRNNIPPFYQVVLIMRIK